MNESSSVVVPVVLFFGVFLVMALLEIPLMKRRDALGRKSRWPHNFALVVVNTLLIKVLLPVTAVGVSLYAETQGLGLFNRISLPAFAAVGLSLVALDMVNYFGHRLMHTEALWRFHAIHHSDAHVDVTTGIRFHPLDLMITESVKWGAILALGCPVLAVFLLEAFAVSLGLWSHSNVGLPRGLDRVLRWGVITPHTHELHHSRRLDESMKNFSLGSTVWDRLFGTYLDAGEEPLRFGIDGYPENSPAHEMLLQPFDRKKETSTSQS